jgi:hypothetical protein
LFGKDVVENATYGTKVNAHRATVFTTSVENPTFSVAAGTVAAGTSVTISESTWGATVYVGKTNPPTTMASSFNVNTGGTYYAQAKLGTLSSSVVSVTYAITSP